MTEKYQIVEGKETGEVAIKLLEHPFEGVVVKIGKVAIKERGDGTASLAFDYDILKGNPEELGDADEFGKVIGDIIVDILENHSDEILESDNGNDGEDNSSQPNAE